MSLVNSRRMLVLVTLLAAVAAVHAQEVTVKGMVIRGDGSPIAGVAVQAFRQGEAGSQVKSAASGEYEVKLASGMPIARIEYRHNSFDLASIVLVSGTDSGQRIVKVMYQVGQSRSVGAIADTVAAYEQFGVNAYVASSEDRQRFAKLSKELELIPKLSRLPIKSENALVDNHLEARRKAVMTLLGGL